MEVAECIHTRRSIRNYESEPVAEDKLAKVLEAAQWAPSWVNVQPWEIVIVDDAEVMKKLADCVPDPNPGKKALAMAPLALAVCGRQGKSGYYGGKESTVYGDWVMFDVGIVGQNICLAAWSEGLGTLHLGLLNHEKAGEVLGLPDDVKLYELIPLGTPSKIGKAPPRRAIKEFTHKNKFGS